MLIIDFPFGGGGRGNPAGNLRSFEGIRSKSVYRTNIIFGFGGRGTSFEDRCFFYPGNVGPQAPKIVCAKNCLEMTNNFFEYPCLRLSADFSEYFYFPSSKSCLSSCCGVCTKLLLVVWKFLFTVQSKITFK